MNKQYSDVKDYYSKVLESKKDLKTSACCPAEALPKHIRSFAAKVAPEIIEKFYGCGVPLPSALEGKTVLDLGCGTGRDAYILAQLVGESGQVIGVDMTDEQLATANRYLSEHMDSFGFNKPNTSFVQGYIEDLKAAGIADKSVDVVVSNCVFNLSPDKAKLFKEVFRVLKDGGELYFSDVYSDRRLPQTMQEDPVLLGECLGGALYTQDLRRVLAQTGCNDYRVVSSDPIVISDQDVSDKLGMTKFDSITVRAFKLPLEDRCEDYGQVAIYKGSVRFHKHAFRLDDHHLFETGKRTPVCRNTAMMLSQTRFAEHFTIEGDCETHYGLFDCDTPSGEMVYSADQKPADSGCC